MKLFWTLQLGIGAASLAFLTAYGCGGNVVVDTPTGTAMDTDETSIETTTECGACGETEPGTDSETDDSCTCACVTLMSAGGCADLCSTLHNGVTVPNFCEAEAPLPECAACIEANCAGLSMIAGTCSGM